MCKVDYLAWFNFLVLKISKMLKTGLRGLGKSALPWKHDFIISVGVSPLKFLLYQVSMVSAGN